MRTQVELPTSRTKRLLTTRATAALCVAAGLLLNAAPLPADECPADECPAVTILPAAAADSGVRAVALQNGVKDTNTTKTGDKQYTFSVPSGVREVTVLLHPIAPGEFDPETEFGYAFLYVNVPSVASFPAPNACSAKSELTTGDNSVLFDRVSSPPVELGTYRIVVAKYGSGTVFEITATYQKGTAGELVLRGKSQTIENGDTTPSIADDTEYGSLAMGDKILHTFTLANEGTEPLHLTARPTIGISGANASDFVVMSQPTTLIEGGKSTTFTLQFKPSATGTRAAVVTVTSDDLDNNPYTFSVRGFGKSAANAWTPSGDSGCTLGAAGRDPAKAWAWYLSLAAGLLALGLAGRRRLAHQPRA